MESLVSIQERLLNYAFKLTRNRMDAEDLLQETNIRVLSKLNTFKTDKDMFQWAASVLHNLFIDKIRADKRSPIINYDVSTQSNSYLFDGDKTINDYHESIKLMGKIIRQLNNIEIRTVFIMRKMGFSYNIIADFTGIKGSTLRGLIFRGKSIIYTALRERFKD
jgi:RNA polymerase sigma-70 factor (ECF subfamily)